MNMDDTWFMEWYYKEAAEEEIALLEKVEDFQELFDDMLFQENTSTYKLIQCKSKPKDSNEWISDVLSLPESLEYFSYAFFHFKVEEMSDCYGCYNHKEQLLSIVPSAINDDSIILHEMIHLHESVINDLPMYYHDMVYWCLYDDLKNKIPKLDEIISGHAHLLTESFIYANGGLHDILFLLKSFDLDIKQGYSLGTVFGYGRAKEFQSYTYNAN